MAARIGFLASLAGNILLAAGLVLSFLLLNQRPPPPSPAPPDQKASTPRPRTGVVVVRQPFTWSEIESEDYPAYVANLRGIGCPESTIRDIILAEVNQVYARKRITEIVTPEQQWWRFKPDPKVAKAALEKAEILEKERRALLDRLLGPGWEKADLLESNSQVASLLNGPVLGYLSRETRLAVQEISHRAEKRLQDYLEEQERHNAPPDPAQYVRLQQQTREELARVLNPEQLEEYLLRTSATAAQMRSEFRDFNLSPEEFRQLFRIRDPLDQQWQSLALATTPSDTRRRPALEHERQTALEQVLGKERSQQYQLLQDPAFRQARSTALALGVPSDAVLPLYQINQARDAEQQRIHNDLSLTSEEQSEALRHLQEEHAQVVEGLLGREVFHKYLESNKLSNGRP